MTFILHLIEFVSVDLHLKSDLIKESQVWIALDQYQFSNKEHRYNTEFGSRSQIHIVLDQACTDYNKTTQLKQEFIV